MMYSAGDATLQYDAATQTLHLEGSLRLPNMNEYEKVSAFLQDILQTNIVALTLDFSKLNFLNSSGITTFSLFILQCRRQQTPNITVIGSPDIAWQEKSLPNFTKLWSSVTLLMPQTV